MSLSRQPPPTTESFSLKVGKSIIWLLSLAMLYGLFQLTLYSAEQPTQVQSALGIMLSSRIFWAAIGVGLLAQLIDGSLGMAYGITSNAFLIAHGVPPATASAAVHTAEIFTTGASGLSHLYHDNVDKALFKSLLTGGILGATVGALALSHANPKYLSWAVNLYLLVMGLSLIAKALWRHFHPHTHNAPSGWIAIFGAALDAMGGGGWGAIVNSQLLHRHYLSPRLIIGTVNTVEFFITFFISTLFLFNLPQWHTIGMVTIGLIVGGLIAAPLAAKILHFINPRKMILLVGLLISGLSLWNLLR